MTFDRAASDHNVATLLAGPATAASSSPRTARRRWPPSSGDRLLDAGAWGITLATPWQVQVARAEGIRRILLANQLVDPVAIAWLARELDADSGVRVRLLGRLARERPGARRVRRRPADRRARRARRRRGSHGRTRDGCGARRREARRERAAAAAARGRRVRGFVRQRPHARRRSTASAATCIAMRGLAEVLIAEWAFHDEAPIVTAGGSTWFDLVAEEWAGLEDHATLVLRSGAFQAHDDVFYTGNSPFTGTDLAFRPALTAWARVVSRAPSRRSRCSTRASAICPPTSTCRCRTARRPASTSRRRADHPSRRPARLPRAARRLAARGRRRREAGHLASVHRVRQWRLLPEVDDAEAADPRVIGFIETVF